MSDSGVAQHHDDNHKGEADFLFVPFTPGAVALYARMASASPEEQRAAVDELAGIGEVLHELISFEDDPGRNFHSLPREYQDWIISLISQVLASLPRNSRPRP